MAVFAGCGDSRGENQKSTSQQTNVSLACLPTTDLVVGLVVQPLEIDHYSFMLKGDDVIIWSTLAKIRTAFTTR